MKWGKLLLGVGWACVLYACSDDDGKDDTIMNMSELTGSIGITMPGWGINTGWDSPIYWK